MIPAARPDAEDDKAEIERLRGLLIDPGSPPWEDARAVLVAELRKAGLDNHADNVAAAHSVEIQSHIALNLIAQAARAAPQDGYATAFYEIADLLGIAARADSPAEVWRDEMRPKLEALVAAGDQDAARPDDDALLPHLPASVRGEKRCGIQRSAWLTGWFIPWSPRNDNENAEGPWSHWVALAHAILKADAAALAALHKAREEGGKP